MAGLCEKCMKAEARSPHDLYCDACEWTVQFTRISDGAAKLGESFAALAESAQRLAEEFGQDYKEMK